MAEFTAVILAAGQGTRMKSEFPKVLHRVCGVPMVEQVIRLVREAGSDHQVVITGFKEHLVREYLGNHEVSFVHQEQQLGTGHAVMRHIVVHTDIDGLAFWFQIINGLLIHSYSPFDATNLTRSMILME